MKLSEKVAIITGGSDGIGKAIATKFAKEGAKIVLCARDLEKLDRAADEIQGLKSESGSKSTILTVSADLSTLEGAKLLIETTLDEFNQIDILVNSAGMSGPITTAMELEPEEWSKVINLNLNGTFFCSKFALNHMVKKQTKGKIINLSSVFGKQGVTHASAYCASKAAVISLTECLAIECGPYNIHVNVICPGFIDTKMFQHSLNDLADTLKVDAKQIKESLLQKSALKRFATIDEVANTALFLATDDSSGITGEIFTVSAGAAYY